MGAEVGGGGGEGTGRARGKKHPVRLGQMNYPNHTILTPVVSLTAAQILTSRSSISFPQHTAISK